TCAPADIAARAAANDVVLTFLTDHDSVSGFPEARDAAAAKGVDLRCGIEINTIHQDNIHILGYGLRWEEPGFRERLEGFRKRREARIERIVEQLKALGLPLEFSDVRAEGRQALGRPHVADALKRRGIVGSRQEAFNRFLAKGKPGYVESAGPSPEEAIALIREAGGFACLAHPETVVDQSLIGRLKEKGLEGIEAYYSSHRQSQIVHFLRVAADLDLLATGGTDFHGPGSGRDRPLGLDLPDDVYNRFMERLSRCS
ncbi:MAG: PHP domain-containing protein, partial [Cyanobacteria bacterium REEB65]|nr:PHP domain-containing protein [Cyanobacteria bacterium REEB65]